MAGKLIEDVRWEMLCGVMFSCLRQAGLCFYVAKGV